MQNKAVLKNKELDLTDDILAFSLGIREYEIANDIIKKCLAIFMRLPESKTASLFLTDKNSSNFYFVSSVIDNAEESYINKYEKIAADGAISKALTSGKVVCWENKREKRDSALIFPVIIPSGVYGIIILETVVHIPETNTLLIKQLSILANMLGSVLNTQNISQLLSNMNGILKQEITGSSLKLNLQIKELNSILENLQAGVLVVDNESGELLNANKAAREIYKCETDQIRKQKLHQCFFNKSVYKSRQGYEEDEFLIDVNGHNIPIITKTSTLLLPGRTTLLVSFIDISNLKNARELLKNNEKRYHNLADNMIDLITEVDINGVISYTSPSYKSVLGYMDDELCNKIAFETVHPEDQAWLKERFETYTKLGISGREEFRIQHKDGHYIWVEALGKPLLDSDGKMNGIILCSRDITARKRSEEALKKSEEQFRYIWKSSMDGMLLINSRGIISMVNDAFCRLIGLDKTSLEGNPFDVIFDEDDRRRIRGEFEDEISSEHVEPYWTKKYSLWDKRKIWFQISSSLLYHAGARPYMLNIFRDITEQKELECKLKELSVQKDKFFSIMAHDLRSPFNGLIGLTKYLIDSFETLSTDELKEFLIDVNAASFDIFNLLENLLSWSRIQMDRMEFNPDRIDISYLAKTNINLLKNNAFHKEIILLDETEEDVYAYGDKFMISSCILNLISNSIKFTSKNGVVRVKTHKINGKAAFEVLDNGIGMSKEVIENIFKYDYMHTTNGTANEKGTGLGLKITKELAEKNHGTLYIESFEGKGSLIRMELPQF